MQAQLSLIFLIAILVSSCTPSITKIITEQNPGEAIIQSADGSHSEAMSVKDAFTKLKSNEKMYIASGRVELFEPLEIENLENIQIIGINTHLVAKIDMPVITFRDVNSVSLENLLVVHEIGEWCAQNCVEFYRASDIDINNCKFDGSGYFGLALTNVTTADIKNSAFYNCEYGLATWNCEDISVKDSEFAKNRAQDVMENGEGQIINNYKSDNTFDNK
ncbi:MAG: right-handed parallel beta-helix repeat-containing protein [Bacteroidota bacterium]